MTSSTQIQSPNEQLSALATAGLKPQDNRQSSVTSLLGKRAPSTSEIYESSQGLKCARLYDDTVETQPAGISQLANISVVDSADCEGQDAEERRQRRLLQNRKSAKKCRMKKKAEMSGMKNDVGAMKEENVLLKEKLNEITIMLYQKMEENALLQRKLDQANTQNQANSLQVLLGQVNGLQAQQPLLRPQVQTLPTAQPVPSPSPAPSQLNVNALLSAMGGQNPSPYDLLQIVAAVQQTQPQPQQQQPQASYKPTAPTRSSPFTPCVTTQGGAVGKLDPGKHFVKSRGVTSSGSEKSLETSPPAFPTVAKSTPILNGFKTAASISRPSTQI